MARSLKAKTSRTIGIVIPNVIDIFFAQVLHGIEKMASKNDYKLLVTFSNDKKEKEEKNLLSLVNHNVDGILISFSKGTQKSSDYKIAEKIKSYDIPLVMFDRVNKDLPFDSVTIDDFKGAQQATNALINSGCRNIAFLSPIFNTSVGESRKEGYIKALTETKKGISPAFIKLENYRTFRKTFSDTMKANAFDGILATDEKSAIYALNTSHQLGLKIPEDVSIIGFTNGSMSLASNPTLSVVSQSV